MSIQNKMTKKELSQLYYLNREIKMDKRRLRELKFKAASPSGSSITGLPKGSAYDNKIERYISDITELEDCISKKILRCSKERIILERYIADIPDSLTRQIFTLRFIEMRSWANIALRVGGGNTVDGVKKVCYRYINQK